jgi:N-acetylglutamate synthase-like GNAT family acetyltransferase
MSSVEIYGTQALDDKSFNSAIALIENVWPDYDHQEITVYRAHATAFQAYFSLAEKDGRVVGLGLLIASCMSLDLNSIVCVAVDADHRSQGIGRALVQLCLQEARRREKRVSLTTTTPDFYTKIGFRMVDCFNPDRNNCLMIGE